MADSEERFWATGPSFSKTKGDGPFIRPMVGAVDPICPNCKTLHEMLAAERRVTSELERRLGSTWINRLKTLARGYLPLK